MATALIATLIAVVLGHTLPELARVRRFDWLADWRRLVAGWFGEGAGGVLGAALVVGMPVALLALLQSALDERFFGLAELALGAAALYYCWGPRDLDLDVDAVASAADGERRRAALSALAPESTGAATAPTGTVLVDAVFRAALTRWFGVLLWFVLLGPAGALLYRLVQLLARNPAFSAEVPATQGPMFNQLAQLLDWPAAQLMTLALAVGADFDAVASAWRDFHAARGRLFTLDSGFLIAAARASVDADIDVGDTWTDESQGPVAEMQEAMTLVWRVLIVWGVVFALFVLAGRIG